MVVPITLSKSKWTYDLVTLLQIYKTRYGNLNQGLKKIPCPFTRIECDFDPGELIKPDAIITTPIDGWISKEYVALPEDSEVIYYILKRLPDKICARYISATPLRVLESVKSGSITESGAIILTHESCIAFLAVDYGKTETLKAIFKAKPALLNHRLPCSATTAHLAAKEGFTETLKAILVMNPQLLETKTRMGNTPAHIAADHGHIETLRAIFSNNSKLAKIKNNNGQTPVELIKNAAVKREIMARYGDDRKSEFEIICLCLPRIGFMLPLSLLATLFFYVSNTQTDTFFKVDNFKGFCSP